MSLDTSELMFGVELEQFPSYDAEQEEVCADCDGSGGYQEEEACDWDEQGNPIGYHEQWYDCDNCYGSGYVTVYGSGSYEAQDAIRVMRKLGLTTHRDMHDYHCSCSDCAPFRTTPLLAAQEDCTVGIEWVSRAMRSPKNLERIVEGHEEVMHSTGWRPNGYDTCGNHIHVGLPRELRPGPGDAYEYHDRVPPITRLAYNFIGAVLVEKDWNVLAAGGCRQIRPYNDKGYMHGGGVKTREVYSGTWIDQKKLGKTFEFRLWNTPKDAWRIIAHAGMSMALTRWGIARAEATIDDNAHELSHLIAEAKSLSLLDTIEEWLPGRWPRRDEVLALVESTNQ